MIIGDPAMASKKHPRRSNESAGGREFRFYVSHAPEINRRFAGKHVAIVGDRVAASGKSPLKVWKRAKQSHPQSKPLLVFVPKRDTRVLIDRVAGEHNDLIVQRGGHSALT